MVIEPQSTVTVPAAIRGSLIYQYGRRPVAISAEGGQRDDRRLLFELLNRPQAPGTVWQPKPGKKPAPPRPARSWADVYAAEPAPVEREVPAAPVFPDSSPAGEPETHPLALAGLLLLLLV